MAKAKSKDAKNSAGDDAIKLVASNRRAFHDYFVDSQFEAGIVLVGTEVKSLRAGHCMMQASFCRVAEEEDEVNMFGVHIPEYASAGPACQHEPARTRKLLLHRREIVRIRKEAREKGTAIIPLKIYFKRGRAKVLIGVCKGKKAHDKRESTKEKDIKKRLNRLTVR